MSENNIICEDKTVKLNRKIKALGLSEVSFSMRKGLIRELINEVQSSKFEACRWFGNELKWKLDWLTEDTVSIVSISFWCSICDNKTEVINDEKCTFSESVIVNCRLDSKGMEEWVSGKQLTSDMFDCNIVINCFVKQEHGTRVTVKTSRIPNDIIKYKSGMEVCNDVYKAAKRKVRYETHIGGSETTEGYVSEGRVSVEIIVDYQPMEE